MPKLPVAMVILSLLAGSLLFYFRGCGPESNAGLYQREIATRVLAEEVVRQLPGKKILVISNPFTRSPGRARSVYQNEEAGIKGLKTGFGEKLVFKVVYPQLRPEAEFSPETVFVDPQSTTPLSYLVTDGAFDRLQRENPDHPVFVSLIGLPANLAQVRVWDPSSPVKFALLLPDWRGIGNLESIRSAFKSGKIIAAVMNKPGAPADLRSDSADYLKFFEASFILITADNFEEIVGRHRHLF